MEIIGKIVKSPFEPKQTNVGWFDTSENELKFFINGRWAPSDDKVEVASKAIGDQDGINIKSNYAKKSEVDLKIDSPNVPGVTGQVLQLDLNRKPEWVTPSAGTTPDSQMSDGSTNAVQNKVIKEYIDGEIKTLDLNVAATTAKLSQLGQKVITEVAGKNLFDDTPLRSKTGITYQNGIFRGKQSAFGGSLPVSGLVAGKRYIFQFEARIVEQQTGTGNGLYLIFEYSDQTTAIPEYFGNANGNEVQNSNIDWKVYSGVTSVKELAGISFTYGSGGNNVIEIRNLMLSEGYNIKTFVPYESLVDGVAREEISDGLFNTVLSLSQKKTIDSCTVIDGPYIKYTDGSREASGSYSVYSFDNSEFMSKYMRVKVADINTEHASIAFYDIDDNYLQAVSVQSANNPAREIIVEVPSAATRIDICNRGVLLAAPEIVFYSLADSSSLDVQSETLHEINKYFVDMSKENVFTLANTRLLKSNGAESSSESYRCSDYIRVFSGDRLDYSLLTENQNIGLLCVYNLDKVFQSCPVYYTSSLITRGTWTATEDGYIRVCTLSGASYFVDAYLHYHNNAITIPERVEILENKLPDYWEEHLATKETEINAALRGVGVHGDELFFFSDYHILRNAGWTPTIIRRLIEKYKVEQVVQCGDIMNTEADDAALMSRFEQYTQAFHDVNVLNVIGNHDYNPYGSLADFGTMYPLLQKNIEHDYQCGGNSLDGYFYRDNAQQKIRYIYLNTRTNGIAATDTVQLDWFKSVLNSVGEGWYVVVFAHLVFEWYQSGNDYTILLAESGRIIKEICDGYQNKTNGTGEGVSWDFTNAHGNIACVLCGHTHIDYSIDSDAGYPIIAIDRDAIDYPPAGTPSSVRTKGTATEQVIDLVCINTQSGTIECVRIGGGVNRSFTFDVNP